MVMAGGTAPILLVLGIGFLAALPAITAGLSALGRVFGGASQGSAGRAVNQQTANTQRDQLLTDRARLDLDRQKFLADEEGANFRRALLGQLMQNAQPLSIQHPGMPKSTGGLSVASLGATGRDMGNQMSLRAMQRLANPGLAPLPDVSAPVRQGGNRFLDILSVIANTGGALGGMFNGGGSSAPDLLGKVTGLDQGIRGLQLTNDINRLQAPPVVQQLTGPQAANTGSGVMRGVRF